MREPVRVPPSGDAADMTERAKTALRSRAWFDDPSNPDMTALYLERYMNFGLSLEELQSGKPIIGIAQTGSDLSPCNRHHLVLAERLRDGIREAGGIAIEFPVHPIQETGKRPTAGLDRNPRLHGASRSAFRLSDRRGGPDDRLRQDHPGVPDGRRDGQYPGHCAFRRTDAERMVQGSAHRLGHDRVEGARTARHRGDRLQGLHQARRPRPRRPPVTAIRWAPRRR